VLDLQTRRDEIGVALTLSNFRIRDAVHLVGHRHHRFREELDLFDVHRKLTGVRDEKKSFDTDEIAVVEQSK
jgi:hypothetical protein